MTDGGPTSRDTQIDNARGALIVLVVFGHLIESLIGESSTYRSVYGAVYGFHMPAFVFICGLLSKATPGPADLRKIRDRIVVPFLVLQVLYVSITSAIAGRLTTPWLHPYWILWFFVSLATWKLLLPLLPRRHGSGLVAASIVLTVLAGYLPAIGRDLSLSRTLYFLPAFLLGHFHGHRLLATARGRPAWCVAGFLGATGVVVWTLAHGASHPSLHGVAPYGEVPSHWTEPGLERLAFVLAGLAASTAAIALVPARGALLSYLGRRTLAIFSLHGFVVLVAWKLLRVTDLAPNGPLLVGLLIAAVLIALALAPLERLFSR